MHLEDIFVRGVHGRSVNAVPSRGSDLVSLLQ